MYPFSCGCSVIFRNRLLFILIVRADYLADKTVTKDNFTIVSKPKEDAGSRSMGVITLALGGFLLAFVVSYLVWLAVYDYKKKPEETEPATTEE